MKKSKKYIKPGYEMIAYNMYNGFTWDQDGWKHNSISSNNNDSMKKRF